MTLRPIIGPGSQDLRTPQPAISDITRRRINFASGSAQARRLVYIDALRGFACLWVIYCHAHASWMSLESPSGWGASAILFKFIGMGGKGVDLFIVISGFCLYYPIAKRARDGSTDFSLTQFYSRRAKRIIPVYFASIAMSLVFLILGFRIASYESWLDVIPYVLFIQNTLPGHIARINGPLWSVALECQLYLLLPLLVWAIARNGVLIAVSIAASASVAAALFGPDGFRIGPFAIFTATALPDRLVQFVMGVLAAWCVVNPRSWHLAVFGLASLLLLPVGLSGWARSFSFGIWDRLGFAAWGVLFATLIIAGHRLEGRGWADWKIVRAFAAVGLISYSLYVVHFPIMLAMEPTASLWVSSPLQGLAIFTAVGLPLTLACAVAMFWLVERHSIPQARYGRSSESTRSRQNEWEQKRDRGSSMQSTAEIGPSSKAQKS